LNGEIVDYGLDAWDLCGVGCGEGAGGFVTDRAGQGGDAILDGRLDGFGAESAIAGDAALEGGGEAGIIGGRCGWGALASGEAEGEGEATAATMAHVMRRDLRSYIGLLFPLCGCTLEHCKPPTAI
jgi:hypothetical protein